MHQRTKRSRHLLGRLGLVLWGLAAVAVAWGADATEDANTAPSHSYVRSLQQQNNYRNSYDHRNYVYVCHRRGRNDYIKREVLDYEVPSIIAAGGGHIGETVPGSRDDSSGFYSVFDVNCQPTPAASCGSDTRTCPDGRMVERDPRQGCAFRPCPEAHCCDASERPSCPGSSLMRGPQCCPTGTWVCPGIFGSYYCGAELGNIRRGFGPVCATATFGTAAMVDAFVPAPPPPPPAPPAVNCQACGGCGYFDGCNSCTCGTSGNTVGCTNRFCPNEREKPRCYECSSSAIVAPPPPPPPPPPAPTTTCSSCPCGFFDGCNTCACNRDGSSICTLRACGPQELRTPRCHPCPAAPAEVAATEPQPPVNCDTCPCGYNDGCNECGCHRDGTGFCSRMFCDVYDTPYCKACPASNARTIGPASCPNDTQTCPDGSTVARDPAAQCSFPACPPLRSCDGGGYRMCPNRKWVALDPRTDCRSFYPCD